MIGDRLIGNRLAYLFSDPKRGDIVMFLWPDDESEIFIKRVIGLPGDTNACTPAVSFPPAAMFPVKNLSLRKRI